MPNAYGYTRIVAHKDGPSIEEQRREITEHFREVWAPHGWEWGTAGFPKPGGWFQDHHNAASTPLSNRRAGFALLRSLRPDDAVIFPKLSVGFQGVKDFALVAQRLRSTGVQFHVLNTDLTPIDDVDLEVILKVCQAKAQMASDHRKENEARRLAYRDRKRKERERRKTGLPRGYKFTGHYGHRKQVRDEKVCALAKKVVEWKHAGWTPQEIYFHLLRKKVRNPRTGGEWSLRGIHRLYHLGLQLLKEEGLTDQPQKDKPPGEVPGGQTEESDVG